MCCSTWTVRFPLTMSPIPTQRSEGLMIDSEKMYTDVTSNSYQIIVLSILYFLRPDPASVRQGNDVGYQGGLHGKTYAGADRDPTPAR